MDATANSLIFMGVGVGVGVGIVALVRPPRPVLWAAAAAGFATAGADFVCASLGHHYDLWHLHGAGSVLGVPLSLTVAWVTLTAALMVGFDRLKARTTRLLTLVLSAAAGATVDHYVLRPSGMLTWGQIHPTFITPYWLSMLALAVGVFWLVKRLAR